jgi:predicted ATPase
VYISRFELRNYKSFYEPKRLDLQPGFNIITGQNSAGKTALLTALSLNFSGSPHRSQRTIPTPGAPVNSISWADVSITGSPAEILRVLQRPVEHDWWIARPNSQSNFAQSLQWTNAGQQDIQRLIEHVFARHKLTFQFKYQAPANQTGTWTPAQIPTFGIYEPEGTPSGHPFASFRVRPDLSFQAAGGGAVVNDNNEFGLAIVGYFQPKVYRFSAERFNIGSSPHGNNPVLKPDAANLPEALGILQANTHRFAHFNELLRSILPQVQHVSVRPNPQNSQYVEIIVWTTAKESERIDLALPLSECGTGLGQVMAILYVMLHPETAETIIIDEPQSFLHPGAARKLIDVLKVHSKQQIIIATHSPTIISAAEPETITIAVQKSSETQLDQLEGRDSKTLETCLAEIGSRLADVFGSDNVLWVEGATEAICFPIILNRIAKKSLMGTAIVGVRQVGDLEGRDAKRVFEIYNSLSATASLIPPAIGFLLDRECRNSQQRQELNKLGKNRVTFLPRRMYENYLLHASAVAQVVNGIADFSATPVAEFDVQKLIDKRRSATSYFCNGQIPQDAAEWVREIDGARVLKEIFAELSQNRVIYDKVKHSVELTKWIVENAPKELEGVAALLTQIVQ